MNESWLQIFTIVGANLVIMLTIFGVTVSMYIHQDTKTTTILNAIKDEMKEFHGRLCAIEERKK